MSTLQITFTNNTGLDSSVPVYAAIYGQVVTATATATASGGKVTSVNLVSGGLGYSATPTVTFVGGGGSGAAATAVMANGTVTAVTVTSGGSGYTEAPAVVFDIPDIQLLTATGTATMSGKTGQVGGIQITDAGSGYVPITVSAPPVTGATATAKADVRNGVITSVASTSAGSDYWIPLTFTPDGTQSASGYATADASGAINHITLTKAGSGYPTDKSVTVTFGGHCTSKASATAVVVAGGVIQSVTLDEPGSGYFHAPSVTPGGPGTGAKVNPVLGSGTISGYTLADGGTGYGPKVTFHSQDAQGSGAAATVSVSQGTLSAITVTEAGSGYDRAPKVTLDAQGFGSGAKAVALGAAKVSGVTVDTPGCYANTPTVTFIGGGTQTPATATATLDTSGGVSQVSMTDDSSLYFSVPTVGFQPADAPGAEGMSYVYFDATGTAHPTIPLTTASSPVVPAFQLTFDATHQTTTLDLPKGYMKSVRILLGVGSQPIASINPDGSVNAPAMANASDPNQSIVYDFLEFTLDETNTLYCDTSQVDQFGFPLKVEVAATTKDSPNKVGVTLPRETVFGSGTTSFSSYLAAMGTNNSTTVSDAFSPLSQTETTTINGTTYECRLLSPADYLTMHPQATGLSTWFDKDIQTLFHTQRTITLSVPNPNAGVTAADGNTVNPQDSNITNYLFTGTAGNGQISFTATISGLQPGDLPFVIDAPTSQGSAQVFACNGVFSVAGASDGTLTHVTHFQNNLKGNIENQLVSALNRGIANKGSGGVLHVTVESHGGGYTEAPDVQFSAPPGGTAATGIAILTGDTVSAVQITSPGKGYTSAPTVTFTSSKGSGAAGTAVIANTDTEAWAGEYHYPYYQPNTASNFYAGYLHANIGGEDVSMQQLAYAFAYDDQGDQSTTMTSTEPSSIQVVLGPWAD